MTKAVDEAVVQVVIEADGELIEEIKSLVSQNITNSSKIYLLK